MSSRNRLPRLSLGELVNMYPEIIHCIPDKIRELKDELKHKKKLFSLLVKDLEALGWDHKDMWFYELYIKHFHVKGICEIEEKIRYFEHILKYRGSGTVYELPRGSPNQITDQRIQEAKSVPIEQILKLDYRSSAGRLIARCPFHEDKTPSFVVYKESNTAWCFGCQQGGDSIGIVQLQHNYSFKEAIYYLT